MTGRGWRCNNCGHVHPATEDLKELGFQWLGPLTSRVRCMACGSYTIQRAFDETFTAGYFLMVKTFNKIQGKGPFGGIKRENLLSGNKLSAVKP